MFHSLFILLACHAGAKEDLRAKESLQAKKKRKKIKWSGHKEVKLVHTEVVDMRVDRQVGICLLSS